ncbi:hypothetical protein [Nannocystis sp.]|uniref:hypothetical protein n=1 Tax=Nannocystis sp. TaxID=1962667 RepID=UPI0025EAD983|nr:hypothetical protein [Nannocystis sp.]MBK7829615.1 hypothetical protein [Nannocystis sp.]
MTGLGGDFVNAFPVPPDQDDPPDPTSRGRGTPTKIAIDLAWQVAEITTSISR